MSEGLGVFCAAYGDTAVIYYDYIYPECYVLSASLLTILIIMYIRAYCKSDLRISRGQFTVTLIYFIIQFLILIIGNAYAYYQCRSFIMSLYLHFWGAIAYPVQTLLLLALLFRRLYQTYKNVPSLSISKATVVSFTICYIITAIVFISGGIMYVTFPIGIGALIYTLSSVLTITLTLILFGNYVYKMYTMYRSTKDEDLIKIIAKNSLLAITSMIITILSFVAFSLIPVFHSMHYIFIVDLFLITDIYTNALCIFLTYRVWDRYYYKICGYCDSKCIRKCIENKDLENIKTEMTRTHTGTDEVAMDVTTTVEDDAVDI